MRRRSKGGSSCIAGDHPNPLASSRESTDEHDKGACTLYFRDFNSNLYSLDFKIHKNVRDGAALRRLIANMCHLDHEETLGLAYSGPSVLAANTSISEPYVPADLDLLIARDEEFSKRMSYTEEYPLRLHRRTAPHPNVVIDGRSNEATSRSAPKEPQPKNITIQANSLLKLDNNSERNGPSLSPIYYGHGTLSPGVAAAHLRETSYRSSSPSTKALKPRIYPSNTTHITDKTPIFILAANYYIFYPNQASELLCDETTTTVLEAVMCGEKRGPSVSILSGPFQGCTFLVNPDDGIAVLKRIGMADVKVVRSAAETIQYCVNPPTDAQWMEFHRPIFLPPGRWCVQAKASSSQEKFSATTARVYTVSVL
ncbi:unnamed protein product [Phytomonas sp. EM1]|nr:unnamed protein product [Phytomonas sp. EM1]|eukprot:CCW60108.1 unnamed protein product [Phytomonas sp. isolate EM1]